MSFTVVGMNHHYLYVIVGLLVAILTTTTTTMADILELHAKVYHYIINCLIIKQYHVKMVIFNLLVHHTVQLVELKFVLMEQGSLYVVVALMIMMLVLYVNS